MTLFATKNPTTDKSLICSAGFKEVTVRELKGGNTVPLEHTISKPSLPEYINFRKIENHGCVAEYHQMKMEASN